MGGLTIGRRFLLRTESSVISSVIELENRQTPANGRKRRRRLEDAKSLPLRELIAKPLISLGFAKSRSKIPTLSASSHFANFPSNFADLSPGAVTEFHLGREIDAE